MGLLDDIVAAQSGGGLVGGLPAAWQYTNPNDLTPATRQMMALVGTQNPNLAGFNPLPAQTDPFPAAGAPSLIGTAAPGATPGNPALPSAPAAAPPAMAAPAVPAFGAGASPVLFANPPGATPGNPALPSAVPPIVAQGDDGEEDTPPAQPAGNAPINIGGYQMPRIGDGFPAQTAPAAAPDAAPAPTAAALAPPPIAPANPLSGFLNRASDALQSISRGGSLTGAIRGQFDDPKSVTAQEQQKQFNALVAAGVPRPQALLSVLNPEAAKVILPHLLAQATHSQETDKDGNVWDVNQQTGERTVKLAAEKDTSTKKDYDIYAAEEKQAGRQPVSFGVFSGKVDGPGSASGLSLNPIYGKDANGNTVLLQTGKNGTAVQSKLPEGVTLNGVDNETLAADAKRLNEGDPNVLKKYSNKGQGRVDLLRLNNEANRQRQEAGLDPIDITQNAVSMQGDIARERAAGNMEGRMAPAAVEAQGAFKIAREASENLARTNFVPYNKILQAGEAAFSNPELKAAATAYNTAVMTYSKAITPTGVGTVTAQEHARQILETADGPKATAAAFDQLSREVDMAHQAPALARQYFADARKARMEGKPPPPMPQYQDSASVAAKSTASKPAVVTQNGHTYTLQADGSYK